MLPTSEEIHELISDVQENVWELIGLCEAINVRRMRVHKAKQAQAAKDMSTCFEAVIERATSSERKKYLEELRLAVQGLGLKLVHLVKMTKEEHSSSAEEAFTDVRSMTEGIIKMRGSAPRN